MSRLRGLAERLDRRRSGPPRPTTPPDSGEAGETDVEESADLLAQRDRLLEKFTIMQADLGGAFYEMAIRDHVRMDVLTRKAAELQRSDAAGNCPSCGAPYGHAVRFCGHCGASLVVTEVAG